MNSYLLLFTFNEKAGISRILEPVKFGVPIQPGKLNNTNGLALIDLVDSKSTTDADFKITSRWPDGTCQWLEIKAVVNIEQYQRKTLGLINTDSYSAQLQSELSSKDLSKTHVNSIELSVDAAGNVEVTRGLDSVKLCFYITDPLGTRVPLVMVSEQTVTVDQFTRQFQFTGGVPSHTNLGELRFSVNIVHHTRSDLLDTVISLHNPQAALHKNGLWDLGDPGRVDFKGAGVVVDFGSNSHEWIDIESNDDTTKYSFQRSLIVKQLSSGGLNSLSTVHVNRLGKLDVPPVGFYVDVDGDRKARGERAVPVLLSELGESFVHIHIRDFWQVFPTAFCVFENQAEVQVYADLDDGVHELQPGERTSKMLSVKFDALAGNADKSWLAHRLDLPEVESAEWKMAESVLQHGLSPLNILDEELSRFIVDPSEFYEKRERIDEYGWRNYGDVFADHESLYVESGDKPLVSHYNNQYDLILGFGLQYLRTMDTRWLHLMDDLAIHVKNIDIYHTELDRVEYNGGLFWHTNHYEDAATATHRTYSVRNYDEKQARGSSGGPSPEHCYTSGLVVHHFLTGDQSSAESVLQLAQWISNYMDGDSCLMGRFHSVAKNEVRNIIQCVRGRSENQYKYPFTRATGNYLNTCLDSHLVSRDSGWLNTANNIVVNTFHHEDCIDSRNLDDIEGTWSHTIFLQAVVRYLVVKQEAGEIDVYFSHARKAFLHYVTWMADNCVPYLDNPSVLEFVNDTWVAQDIRRHGLFCAASRMDPARVKLFSTKADQFSAHIIERLEASDTLTFTRIQAVILQNMTLVVPVHSEEIDELDMKVPNLAKISILRECISGIKKLGSGVRNFNWRFEYRWIKSRFL